jgi:cytochrome c oxidase subunit 2
VKLSSAKTNFQSNFFTNLFYAFELFFLYSILLRRAGLATWIADPATPIMESMINFHNYLMLFLITIGFFVTWMLFQVFRLFNENLNRAPLKFTHSSLLEIIWTIFPAFVLLLIAIPSFALLYSLDELIDPSVTIKIIGHQWYWSYEISDFLSLNGESLIFDSYMTATNDLTRGAFRLLEVDQRVVLPIDTHIRLLVTAADVLHSWACLPLVSKLMLALGV